MRYINVKRVIKLGLLLAVVGLTPASIPTARAGDDKGATDVLSSPCDSSIDVPAGNEVAAHVYAVGVQLYRWNGTSWTFVEPVATLYADADYHKQVGTHYLGPTWESNDGSKVAATRLAGCSPDPTAIPWLLLKAASTDAPGLFNSTTYIQRVKTIGGLAPTARGASIGVVAEVPYTTEYYFYRAKD